MKKIMVIVMVLAAAWSAAAKVISPCDSAPIEVDSRSGVKYESATNVAKTVTWNAAWVDTPAANARRRGSMPPAARHMTFLRDHAKCGILHIVFKSEGWSIAAADEDKP